MLHIKFKGNQSAGSREEICKDQPKVIICAIMVVLGYPMLHTKFQNHWSTGSREEDFQRFLPYMSMVAILVM